MNVSYFVFYIVFDQTSEDAPLNIACLKTQMSCFEAIVIILPKTSGSNDAQQQSHNISSVKITEIFFNSRYTKSGFGVVVVSTVAKY